MPDTKDWTWVLERPCPDCGFVSADLERSAIGDAVRETRDALVSLLAEDPALVRAQPAPEVWSALEYGCHVRDVYRLFAERLELMLSEDDPRFANWDQDETAITDRYAEQDPATVSAELEEAGTALAAAFDAVADDQWTRTGRRSDGAVFTVESFGHYLVHDPVHHIWDINHGYATLIARS